MWAFTDTHRNFDFAPADSTASRRVVGFFRRLYDIVPAWLQRDVWQAELHGLDDRTLSDLAISRGDFPAILAGTFERPPADHLPARASVSPRRGV